MRLRRRNVAYRLLCGWLSVGCLLAPACRVGYEVDSAGGSPGSKSGKSAGGTATGGADGGSATQLNGSSGAASQPAGAGGTEPAGGVDNAAASGAASQAGDAGRVTGGASAAASGGAGDGGGAMAGNGQGGPGDGGGATAGNGEGGASAVAGCSATADCSCAGFAGHRYWFCTPAKKWSDAEADCESQSMQLVRIDSQGENDFLIQQGTQSGVFTGNGFAQIGANDQAMAGEWRWVDGTQFWQGGSSGMPVGALYANWLASSPSAQGVQQCAGILSSGAWQDRSCTALGSFVCEGP